MAAQRHMLVSSTQVSIAGAQRLLGRYWPAAPRADGDVTIDLRSQRYVATQGIEGVLFLCSHCIPSLPLMAAVHCLGQLRIILTQG